MSWKLLTNGIVFILATSATMEIIRAYRPGTDDMCTADCCTPVLYVSTIIETLRWWNVFIFYDVADDIAVSHLIDTLEEEHGGLLLTVYDVTEMNQTSIYQLFIRIYPTDSTEFHAILILQNKTRSLLTTIDDVDNISNKTTNYQTYSKWILLTTVDPEEDMLGLKLQLKHVIVLYDYHSVVYPFVLIDGVQSEIKCLVLKEEGGVSQCTDLELYPNCRFKLNGRHLVIGTVRSPFLDNKLIEDLAYILAKALNFSFTFVQPEDQRYDGNSEGVREGVVGQLVRAEVDFSLADLTITTERLEVIDYISPPLFSQSLGVVYRKDVGTKSNWFKVFRPLHRDVYIGILGTILFVGILLFTLHKLETTSNNSTSFRLELLHFANILIFLISFVAVRGNGIWPNAGSTRILIAFVWMFCVVITDVYVGNLTAKLSETKIKKPFNSLEELADLPDWKWGLRGGRLDQKYVDKSNAELFKNLWNGIVAFNKTDPTVLHPDPEFHINRLMNPAEKYAFITTDPKYHVLSRNDCLLEYVDGVISALQIAIGVPKNSYLKTDLETVMWKLSDNGFLNMLEVEHTKDNRPKCKTVNYKRPMRVEDLKGALLIMGFGMFFTLIALLVECMYNYQEKK